MPHLSEGNRDKTMKAPACAIIGYDLTFYARPPKGQDPLMAFDGKPEAALTYALRNGSLQGGYFMLAARALGLDWGPCRASTMPAWIRSFSPARTSNRIFCAMWDTVIRPRCARAVRALLSTRWRKSSRAGSLQMESHRLECNVEAEA